jgi:L-lysine 2,3-aminomutase
VSDQPYVYRRNELREPDWRRLPGWRDVTSAEWPSAQWQRAHCVKSLPQLRTVFGDLLDAEFYADLERDQAERATMSMLLPPQMINTMVPGAVPTTGEMFADPVRRYMLPVRSDRHPEWPSHPYATRDSLHEHEMWAVEGLTHRYPTKVLAEVLSTCPQYCGHCTRMDLVGNSTPQVLKLRFRSRPADRLDAMVDYLRRTPGVRDVVVSGGDVANMPWKSLESFVRQLLDLESIRDIRLATKALMGLPQHWLQPELVAGLERLARTAHRRGVNLAIHTHVNHVNSVTPLRPPLPHHPRPAGRVPARGHRHRTGSVAYFGSRGDGDPRRPAHRPAPRALAGTRHAVARPGDRRPRAAVRGGRHRRRRAGGRHPDRRGAGVPPVRHRDHVRQRRRPDARDGVVHRLAEPGALRPEPARRGPPAAAVR